MRFSSFLKVALVCALVVASHAGISFGLTMDFTQSPWHADPSCQDEYCVYNNTGERVFIYHEKTGIKYTLEPGQSGNPSYRGEKIKFHPSEIRCGFLHGSRQCAVRLAPFGYDPVLVLEALDYPQATRGPRPRIGTPPPARQVQLPEREVRKASAPATVRPELEDLPELLKLLLERMIHVYHRERGEAKDRKLAELKQIFDRQLADILPRETSAKLRDYEALCKCIHERAASGMDLDEIFREGRCGARSTRELRAAIVRDFAQRIKQPPARPAM